MRHTRFLKRTLTLLLSSALLLALCACGQGGGSLSASGASAPPASSTPSSAGVAYSPLLNSPYAYTYTGGALQLETENLYQIQPDSVQPDSAKILVSYDGGESFVTVPCALGTPAGVSAAPYALYISPNVTAAAYYSDGQTHVAISTDRSKTWTEHSLGDNPFTVQTGGDDFPFVDEGYYIQFVDQAHGWLFIQSAPVEWPYEGAQQHFCRLFTTADGGSTWTETNYPNDLSWGDEPITGIGFSTDKIGFVSLPITAKRVGPYVERTDDGGATWQMADLPPINDGTPLSPAFDGANGILPVELNYGTVYYRTDDYGKTWTVEPGVLSLYGSQ